MRSDKCRKDHIQRSSQSWALQTSTGHEESFCFRTVLLPGASVSAPGTLTDEKDIDGGIRPTNPNGRNITIVSALISTSLLPRFLSLVSSISTSPPAIGDRPPYVVKTTQNKGLGMFARRDIQKGELIVWERPAVIVPGLERNSEASRDEVYQLLVEAFLEGKDTAVEGEIRLGSEEDIREAGKGRYEDIRNMAISSSFDGGHWFEGVVRANALVLEFEENWKKSKQGKREIYGGVCPLINRCNHSCVPNAAVQFIPSLLTLCLYALRDITAGEEITKPYVNPLLPREKRMNTLRQNYGFECDCGPCILAPTDSTASDERRSQLADILSTPAFTRWASDLARADEFLAEKHRSALNLVEEEQVWVVERVFLEEIGLACALMGDGDGFRNWAQKVVDAGRWVGQVGEFGEFKEKENWSKWVWWLKEPEKRVKKWGWRKKMREELRRRKNDADLEAGMLEDIFGHLEDD